MPAQLTTLGIDRNSPVLSILWRVVLVSKFIFTAEHKFIFPRMTVLLGGSLVKKLSEFYDLTK